jgi:hypothetical protein
MLFFWALWCSSWFLSILSSEVDDARDGSWRHYFTVWLYLAAKPSHVGVDMDGLAYPLHRLTACSYQPSVVSSHRCSGGGASPGDVRAWIFGGVLIVWVPTLPNLTWSKSFFTMACLSSARVIMAFCHVSLV